jgi:rod shape-determining protein MreD
MEHRASGTIVFPILISILIGLILEVIPMGSGLSWYRPEWMLLIVLYWLFEFSGQAGLLLAWLAGLSMDVVTGGPLGLQAFAIAFSAFLFLRYYNQSRYHPMAQQMLVIAQLAFILLMISFWGNALFGHPSSDIKPHFLSVITSVLAWPVVRGVLRVLT